MILVVKNKRQKLVWIGLLFGLSFPLFALIIDCFVFNSRAFTIDDIGLQLNQNPIHYIIFLAPVVLGTTFYFTGRSADRRDNLNIELARANRLISNSNELLDNFNYHVSHDLKTVLNNQVVLTQMLLKYTERKDIEKIKEITEKLSVASKAGLTTVSRFLDISRQGFVQGNHEVSSVDVENVLRTVITKNNLTKQLTINIETKQFSTLLVNESMLESMLLNLVTNAIKYTNQKTPILKIQLLKKGKTRQLVFEDNGIGINLEKHGDLIFEPFRRIKNETNTEGTGIGLFLVKKMLNSIDAEIKVESEVGVGTKFTLLFYER